VPRNVLAAVNIVLLALRTLSVLKIGFSQYAKPSPGPEGSFLGPEKSFLSAKNSFFIVEN